MKWSGTVEFKELQGRIREEMRVSAARICMEAAKETRDRALEGFTTYGIGLITGRSRALYAAQPGEGMFQPGAERVSYEAGYTDWPEADAKSGGQPIPFYPWYLNFGTEKMAARPFHTTAVEAVDPVFKRRIEEAFSQVLSGVRVRGSGIK